jgi:hypothetical protein
MRYWGGKHQGEVLKLLTGQILRVQHHLKRVELGGIDWSGSPSFKRALV